MTNDDDVRFGANLPYKVLNVTEPKIKTSTVVARIGWMIIFTMIFLMYAEIVPMDSKRYWLLALMFVISLTASIFDRGPQSGS